MVTGTWKWDRGPRRSEERRSEDRVCRGRRGGEEVEGPVGSTGRAGLREEFLRRQGSWGPTGGVGRLNIHVIGNLVKSSFQKQQGREPARPSLHK